jgi:hypothetical protein
VKLILKETAKYLGGDFPKARVATGPDGSLRLSWPLSDREVRLVVGGSATNKTYLYWETGPHHGIDYRVNGARLAELLSGSIKAD